LSRLPIRVRLTAAFATAMIVVLAAAGLFVYVRLRDGLDESLSAALESRAAAVVASGRAAAGAGDDDDEEFAQLLERDGGVLDAAGGAEAPAITAAERERAAQETIELDRSVPGIEGTARVRAGPAEDGGPAVVVVGQSLEDRYETLAGVAASFAIGGPIAVILASLVGYLLAAAALAPVEAMRRRAAGVSLAHDGERLPLPAAHDEIRRLGETLNAMLDRLRVAHARERRFVADASHELRTPLAVIKTELEGALRAGGHDPDVQAALTAAVEECDQLAQLADDLLVLARAGEARLPVSPHDVDVTELLERVRDRFADRARARDVRIRVEAPGGLHVEADALRLGQALSNVVDNALRHGAGDVVLRARAARTAVELEVTDAGPGFPPELGERAFERFARGDAARTRDGAGLGLAIVRAIAEAHGGTAEIVAGSTVRISVPARGPAVAEAAPQGHLSGRS
jgi:signal transduction histidine kinase